MKRSSCSFTIEVLLLREILGYGSLYKLGFAIVPSVPIKAKSSKKKIY